MRTKSRLLTSLAFASALAVPIDAYAQDDEKKPCEPGSWFCGETQQSGKDLQPLPPEKSAEKPAEKAPEKTPPPPVVVYQPPPPAIVVQPRDAPPPYYYVPKKPPPKKEWGINLHIGGAMIGNGYQGNASMGMTGLGFRFRPATHFALEADLDFAGGNDYNGYDRTETSFALNGLFFLNPKNVTQVYLLAGLGKSWAHATDHSHDLDYNYSYFGVQGGIGLEFRVSRVVALNIDLRGIVRGRTDDYRRDYPEFVSPTSGQTTNTSGAGLLQGGITFYW